ncbi:MAG: R3H domain-containing nucleic acid-binding protein [Dehalococcoidia bacterium]|nr:R3H domain-containing nucleic acid-binding protein [Dehalococcoidia bacterium]
MEATAIKRITDDLDEFMRCIPPRILDPLKEQQDNHDLLEVVLDLGRLPEARYPKKEIVLSDDEVTEEDIQYVVHRIGEFGEDNRAGIERTLHRISAIRNRQGRIVGLTCRVGRAVFGTIKVIEDIIRTGKSTLLLGRPGVGKTTMLREVARVLADDMNKRVVIVDTSNEIAGDGDIPHPAIGTARRMQVKSPLMQHAVMIEAVENHMPEVIVIDEIGTELEALAARTIAERGVQLVATAHGNTLENLMMNPTLSDLIGGIQSVTLSDEEARRRRTQKSILERKAPPTFNVVVEIQTFDRVAVHPNVAETVDAILRGYQVEAEVRELDEEGRVRRLSPADLAREKSSLETFGPPAAETRASPAAISRTIYPFGISRKRLEQAIRQTASPALVSDHLDDADVVMTLRSFYRRKPQVLREAEARGLPIYVLRSNTISQMEQSLIAMQGDHGRFDPVSAALQEAEKAISTVMTGDGEVELSPQNAYIRRLQHQLAQKYSLSSRSLGREPLRRVRIFRGSASPEDEDRTEGAEHKAS